MTHRVNNDNNNTNQKASGRRARVLPKPKRHPFHPQRATRARRLQLPVVSDVLELKSSPTSEGPLTPPATAGWKEDQKEHGISRLRGDYKRAAAHAVGH